MRRITLVLIHILIQPTFSYKSSFSYKTSDGAETHDPSTHATSVVGADRVITCEAGMRKEPFIVDGLPACRRLHNGERKVKVLHSTLFVCWKILIDCESIDEDCLQNPSRKVDTNCIWTWAVYQNRFDTGQPHPHPPSAGCRHQQ
jgi:hypothetical protein